MKLEKLHNKIGNNVTELEKIENALEVCINELYTDKANKNGVAYILEMTNDKLSTIKDEFDRINN